MVRKSPTPLALSEIVRIVGADSAYLYFCVEGTERLYLKSARDAEGHEIEATQASLAVVERVRLSREPLAVSGDAEGVAQLDGARLPARL